MNIYEIKYKLNNKAFTSTRVLQNESEVMNGLPIVAELVSYKIITSTNK